MKMKFRGSKIIWYLVFALLFGLLFTMLFSVKEGFGSHGGGKIDCKNPKNKDHKDCQKK